VQVLGILGAARFVVLEMSNVVVVISGSHGYCWAALEK
jgi:hypothetical protein